jgi:hypothetical protein
MRTRQDNRMETGHMNQPFRSIPVLLLAASSLLSAPRSGLAQAGSILPIPMVNTYAGVPPGSVNAGLSNPYCANSIPQWGGLNEGDGCPALNQATLTSMYDVQVDADGNVFTSEQSTNYDLRVVYKGGAALTAALIAANPTVNFTPVPGNIYTIGGGSSAALTAKSGVYYCGNTTTIQALDNLGNGCPAALSYFKPKGLAIDAYGDIIAVSTASKQEVRVIYAGGPQMAALIKAGYAAASPAVSVTPQIGYIYAIAGNGATGAEGDGGAAYLAGLVNPRYIALDSAGNVEPGHVDGEGLLDRLEQLRHLLHNHVSGLFSWTEHPRHRAFDEYRPEPAAVQRHFHCEHLHCSHHGQSLPCKRGDAGTLLYRHGDGNHSPHIERRSIDRRYSRQHAVFQPGQLYGRVQRQLKLRTVDLGFADRGWRLRCRIGDVVALGGTGRNWRLGRIARELVRRGRKRHGDLHGAARQFRLPVQSGRDHCRQCTHNGYGANLHRFIQHAGLE